LAGKRLLVNDAFMKERCKMSATQQEVRMIRPSVLCGAPLAGVLLAAAVAVGAPHQTSEAAHPFEARSAAGTSVMERHASDSAKDQLRVTVMLAGVGEGPANVGEIAKAQDKFIADLAAGGLVVKVTFKFANVPSMILEADRATCERIRARPDVRQVVEDFVVRTQ
jgi:hypothetical protein